MRRHNLDLILAGLCAASNVVWTLLPSHIPVVSIVLVLPLVFLLPGYLLMCVLTYRRTPEISYDLTLSLGLSIPLDILLGFILNVFPGGLQATSWAVALSLCTIGLIMLAARLRGNTQTKQAPSRRVSSRFLNLVLVGLAVIIATSAVLSS